MKFRATKKEINKNYWRILGVSYCGMQSMLTYHDPIAYSARAEGWACDYYHINGVLISTGYAPLSSKGVKKPSYDVIQSYEKKAEKIVNNWEMKHEDKKVEIEKILFEFLDQVKEGEKND